MKMRHFVIAMLMLGGVLCGTDAFAASCKVGSHEGHTWIKSRNKNCKNCGEQKNSKGETVYYCYCDCEETSKVVKASACKKDQYSSNGKCMECPGKATCDGKTFVCIQGYTKDSAGKKCVIGCKPSQYLAGNCNSSDYACTRKHCISCPKNATCKKGNVSCNQGFHLQTAGNGAYVCEKSTVCSKNQYKNASLGPKAPCLSCPKNATCDGTSAKCNKGFVNKNAQLNGGAVECVAEGCSKNQYRNASLGPKAPCLSCPKNATCDGTSAKCNKGFVNKNARLDGAAVECEKQ